MTMAQKKLNEKKRESLCAVLSFLEFFIQLLPTQFISRGTPRKSRGNNKKIQKTRREEGLQKRRVGSQCLNLQHPAEIHLLK